ncbi:Bacterial protein of uncharacterised function (DUF951) [Acholeplasma oculi]|uniref:DUF951 domain-containing protein n=1 Tax=Acholeplasma oculi TaxID=35623 RepID=A0A061AIJ6_9MOLU|nr:DUF951 domain-containing protein [Acholeplasma oculi]CDR31451.1 hypothetical protein, DUF951 [Acholeplasma oculi]SKC48844.1 hypothetical protein SAMN02745122_1355 [Acholeplasma oculi]SUT92093.1 Bacterial protein of uncharacterised function (DUF951) [Acholeplasma oculi]
MGNYVLGQIIQTKKPHVCGSKDWEVLRTGVDIKLKCVGCGREIMMLKYELDKRLIKK